MQTIAQGALRGLNDTATPLLYSLICFWLIAFPACYGLGFTLGLGAVGIWIALSVALIIYAADAGAALPPPDPARIYARRAGGGALVGVTVLRRTSI